MTRVLPPPKKLPPIDGVIDLHEWSSLCASHPRALAEPRAQARALCGLSSPASTRTKLSRHRLFGALEEHRFSDVLAWCAARTS
jgi:ATP-dependent DNA helicase RecQ